MTVAGVSGLVLTGLATAISSLSFPAVAALDGDRTISVFAGDFSVFRAIARSGLFFGGDADGGVFDLVDLEEVEAIAFFSTELLEVFFVLLATADFFGAEGLTAFGAGLFSTTILAFGGAVTARLAGVPGGGTT